MLSAIVFSTAAYGGRLKVSRRGLATFSSSIPLVASATMEEYARPPSIHFYDDVTKETCLKLTHDLEVARDEIVASGIRGMPIHMHIQSGGGSLTAALYVCDVMERFPIPIYTFVEGNAASAASLISVCGDRRYMTKRSTLLVHQASVTLGSTKNDDLQDESYNMRFLTELMMDVYSSHTPLTRDRLESLISNERYIGSSQALEMGIVDEIL